MLIEELVAVAAERQGLTDVRFEGLADSRFVFSAHKGTDLRAFTCTGRDDIVPLEGESLYDILEAAELCDYRKALETLAAANARALGPQQAGRVTLDDEGFPAEPEKALEGNGKNLTKNPTRYERYRFSRAELRRFFLQCCRSVPSAPAVSPTATPDERDDHEAIVLGTAVCRLLEDVFILRFQANPKAYRAYGPYWPAMKAVLQKRGVLRRGSAAESANASAAEMARSYGAASDLETLLTAERFYEWETSHHPEGRTDFCLTKDDGNRKVWSVMDAEMEALGREIEALKRR